MSMYDVLCMMMMYVLTEDTMRLKESHWIGDSIDVALHFLYFALTNPHTITLLCNIVVSIGRKFEASSNLVEVTEVCQVDRRFSSV